MTKNGWARSVTVMNIVLILTTILVLAWLVVGYEMSMNR